MPPRWRAPCRRALAPAIDILINNAGITGPNDKLWDYPVEAWKNVFTVNVHGVFHCCRAVVPLMRARNYGRIVNIASVAGKEGNPNASAYSASKAAVIGLTKSLGKELADTGIRVNCVTPAAVRTPLFAQMTQQHVDYMLSKIPLGPVRRAGRDRRAGGLARERGMLVQHGGGVRPLGRPGDLLRGRNFAVAFTSVSCHPASLVSWLFSSRAVLVSVMRAFSSQDFGFRGTTPSDGGMADSWAPVPHLFRALQPLPAPWEERFGPLKAGAVDDLVVVGQFGQSLDGRVATEIRSFALHQRAGRARPSASAARAGRRRRGRRRHRARRRPAAHGSACRGPQSGARRDRSARPDGGRRPPVRARRRAPPGGDGAEARGRSSRPTSSASVLPATDGAHRAGRDPRRARRARLPPHADRGRLAHGVAFHRGRLPRSPAHRGRADHPRRRPRRRRARAGRRSCADALRPPMRLHRSTARCCSTAICRPGASRDRAREEVDVTDAHR